MLNSINWQISDAVKESMQDYSPRLLTLTLGVTYGPED